MYILHSAPPRDNLLGHSAMLQVRTRALAQSDYCALCEFHQFLFLFCFRISFRVRVVSPDTPVCEFLLLSLLL